MGWIAEESWLRPAELRFPVTFNRNISCIVQSLGQGRERAAVIMFNYSSFTDLVTVEISEINLDSDRIIESK